MTNTDKIQHFNTISRQYSDTSILMHEAIARKAGLSGTDHKYLGLIVQRGEMTAGELSKITGLTTGAVTGLIDRLENKKLVKRRFDSKDRRKVIVVPDEQNTMNLLGPLFTDLQNETAKLISTFSESEIKTIENYFTSAIKLMRETTEKLNNK